MTNYNIWQGYNTPYPHTTLHNMGAHPGSSTKERNPWFIEKAVNVNYNRNKLKGTVV